MSVQRAERSGWSPLFDTITGFSPGRRAAVERASLALGDRIEAERAPRIGIASPRENDLLEALAKGGGGHGRDPIRGKLPGRVARLLPRAGVISLVFH